MVYFAMRISLDLDDVLAEFQRGWLKYNNENYGTSLVYEDFVVFDYSKVMGIGKDEWFRRIFEFYKSDSFPKLEVVAGAREALNTLAEHNELFVLTSRPQEIKKLTETWLGQHFDDVFKEIIFTSQVSLDGFNTTLSKADVCKNYSIDLHVEDAPMYVYPVIEAGTRVAVVNVPWNADVIFESPLVMRINSIVELPQAL